MLDAAVGTQGQGNCLHSLPRLNVCFVCRHAFGNVDEHHLIFRVRIPQSQMQRLEKEARSGSKKFELRLVGVT